MWNECIRNAKHLNVTIDLVVFERATRVTLFWVTFLVILTLVIAIIVALVTIVIAFCLIVHQGHVGEVLTLMSSSESDVETFAEDVVRLDSHYNYDAYERDVLFFLVKTCLLNIRELFNKEGDIVSL